MGKMDIRDVQDRWIDNKDAWDEKERKELEEEEAKMREQQDAGNGDLDDFDEMNIDIPLNSGIKVTRRK